MARWYRRLAQTLTADYCPLYLHWSFWSTPDAGQQLRLWASRYQGYGRRAGWRRLLMLVLTLTWPVRALLLISQHLRTFAPTIRQRTGAPLWRQAWEQLWLAFVHALPPVTYYHYELYRPEQKAWVDAYVHQHETRSLLPHLNRYQQHPAIDDKEAFAQLCGQAALPNLNRYQQHPAIDDKEAFAQLCGQAALPTVPILAVGKAGRVIWHAEAQQDLFLKPITGARGEGAQRWYGLAGAQGAEGVYQDAQGKKLSRAEFRAMLRNLSQKRGYLVQPCLTNHTAIADLSPGALATVRIVTGRTPDGTIELIAATFKMAWRPSIINTYGLNSPVNRTTGQLGRAYSYHPICPGFAQHPVTAAPIIERLLPDWLTTATLAQQAHRHFPGYVFLGWDVALTPHGPLLLEGNAGWDVLTVQKPQRTPLAHTRFAAICRLWMQAGRP